MLQFVPATRFEKTPDLEMRFPPLPNTVAEVSRLLAEQVDVPDTNRLMEVVGMDPVTSASVLRRINSAYYGLRRRIGDIRKAVFLLGFLEVSNLVLTEGMMKLRSVVRSEEQARIFDQIMRLSIATASFAQELAHALRIPNKAAAFTAGLLHSVGRLVLLYNKPNDYEALWWTNDSGLTPSAEAEQVIFGTDHARLGGMAMERWHLPEEIAAVIENYLMPQNVKDPAATGLAHIISVSVSAAEQLFQKGPAAFEPGPNLYGLATSLQASPAELVRLIEARMEAVARFVGEAMRE